MLLAPGFDTLNSRYLAFKIYMSLQQDTQYSLISWYELPTQQEADIFSCQNPLISQKETKISFLFSAPVFIIKPLAPVAFIRPFLPVWHMNSEKFFPSALKPYSSIHSKSHFGFSVPQFKHSLLLPWGLTQKLVRNINIT